MLKGRRDSALFSFARMKMRLHFLLLSTLAMNVCLSSCALAQPQSAGDAQPDAYTYKRVDGKELKAYVFEPPHSEYGKPRAAMLVFHGGAWDHGSAQWTFGQARYFTSLGMVGISVDYRLANGDSATPFDTAEDARAAVRWARSQAELLNSDPKRIGAYGESAGGLLAAATAITEESPAMDELSAIPNVLVLVSPALNVEKSARFLALAGKRQDIASIELGEHVRRGLPPTIILTGALDAAIPPASLAEFCEKMRQAKNRCELEIYPGVGHMLEPPENTGRSQEDAAKTRYDVYLKADQFLASMGYIPVSKPKN
jgi:acetyl esterase/lipase